MSWWFSRRGVPSIPRSQSRWRAMSEGNQGSASSDALRKPLLHRSSWRAMSYSVPLFLSDDALIVPLDTFCMTYAILETCKCGLASPLIGVRGSLSLPAGYPLERARWVTWSGVLAFRVCGPNDHWLWWLRRRCADLAENSPPEWYLYGFPVVFPSENVNHVTMCYVV